MVTAIYYNHLHCYHLPKQVSKLLIKFLTQLGKTQLFEPPLPLCSLQSTCTYSVWLILTLSWERFNFFSVGVFRIHCSVVPASSLSLPLNQFNLIQEFSILTTAFSPSLCVFLCLLESFSDFYFFDSCTF